MWGGTEAHVGKAAEKRTERWRRIAHVAAEELRRPSPPEIELPVPLSKAMATAEGSRIVLSELEENVILKSALADIAPPITLAFGPEGGWAPEELEVFRSTRWVVASLGSTILRAATA